MILDDWKSNKKSSKIPTKLSSYFAGIFLDYYRC